MSQATVSGGYYNSNLFSNYYLDERVYDLDAWDCDEEARDVFEELQALYELEGGLVDGYGEDALIDNWIDEVLSVLGFGTQIETTLPEGDGFVDVLLFESPDSRREAASVYLDTRQTGDLFERGLGLVEAKQWDADFSARFSERRPYHNASQQIKRYLNKTPKNIQWGVLTNGRKWRLYGTKDYETQTYYEVDLPELLERGDLELFKYFYVFFRPEAFQSVGDEMFLDTVWSESETAAQELGEDLQDNVFTALRVLGRGFVETNDLDIDPEDDEALDELKEQSLVLLYRLMFVLYAESRGLIHPEDARAQSEYEENFSLDALRLDIHDEIGEVDRGFDAAFSEYSTGYWTRLQNLFELIDEGEKALGIPPYNGGLFDHDKNAFLAENEVNNRHLAEVIYRLSTTENDEGRYVLADYADLDTRHLGTVYEGLLEHQFEIAPEEYAAVAEDGGQVWKPATEVTVADAVETVPKGGLYVVNDQGERKATGAYYTPDYVVTYIVEETVGPLVDEIRDDLVEQGFDPGTQEYLGPFLQRVTNLKILDPAMGSGHFLTRATGFLAQRVMDEVREVEEELGVAFDEQHVRREIAKECIYGVDINGMAVELAKLSMWLETLAADRPLAFLDHHLKAGNSLVGSDVTEVLTDDNGDGGGQLTLSQALARVRQDTLEHVMELMEELLAIDNETLDDVRSMEEIYDEIRDDPLYGRLFELTNVHTAEAFGVDVPEGVYEQMAGAIESETKWNEIRETEWFINAQAVAEREQFFHWELEYPEVFFDITGSVADSSGFDAVIGNPPYVRIYGDTLPDEFVEYLRVSYDTAYMKFDLYVVFSELGLDICRNDGLFSYIIPDKFTSTPYGEPLRELILFSTRIESILDLRDQNVFKNVTVSNLIPVLRKSTEQQESIRIRSMDSANVIDQTTLPLDAVVLDDDSAFRLSRSIEDMQLSQKIREQSIRFDRIYYTNWGLRTGTEEKTDKYIVSKTDDPRAHPMIRGQNIIDSYRLQPPQEYVIYNKDDFYNPMFEELFENKKIVFRKISGSGLMAVADEEDYYCFSTLICCVNIQNVAGINRSGIPNPTQESSLYQNLYYPLAIVNSKLIEWFYNVNLTDELSVVPGHINEIPINKIEKIEQSSDSKLLAELLDSAHESLTSDDSDILKLCSETIARDQDREIHDLLAELAKDLSELHNTHISLNLNPPDYLGTYTDGHILSEIGLTQPPEGSADSILQKTTETYPNLRVGTCEVVRESPTSVEIRLTARYKPEDDSLETDRWGYTETEPLPALYISELTETEADLIEQFVPYAVDEAGGFADFRETATKTNSLVDRLRKLTLPAVDDVADGLANYIETKARAEELEAKIEKTDRLIDEIVYELYGLTDEEIEIVEEAVGD